MPRNLRKSRSAEPVLKIKKINSLQWIFEPLENNPDFFQKRMFGCQAGYLGDRLILVLADGDEPWNGVLVPTEREFHPSLLNEFPQLKPHAVLGKWLYLSQASRDFEETTSKLVRLIIRSDSRFGVDPKPKKTKKNGKKQ